MAGERRLQRERRGACEPPPAVVRAWRAWRAWRAGGWWQSLRAGATSGRSTAALESSVEGVCGSMDAAPRRRILRNFHGGVCPPPFAKERNLRNSFGKKEFSRLYNCIGPLDVRLVSSKTLIGPAPILSYMAAKPLKRAT